MAEKNKTSATSWIDALVCNAVESRASDIHIEPDRDIVNVRFRIDGFLHVIEKLPVKELSGIISRLKVISQLNITECRVPQDGHFELDYKGKIHNLRLSTFPTIYGEAAVMRILNREDIMINIDNLGFNKEQFDIIRKLIARPYGMILITGPSGSGKTTLLYSILNNLNKSYSNIVTLEDPVELQMTNVRQLQINESIGLSFSRAMRAVLRQDPNIVMIGEIRDPETAQMAIQAALTGVLVLSTFHTLDVPGVVTRLIEMGLPRSVMAHALAGVVSSRLVRKICPHCAKAHQLDDFEKSFLGFKEKILALQKPFGFQKGQGCDQCRNSGYLGRTGIYEIIYFDDEIKAKILEGASVAVLKKAFQDKKMKNLREAAIEKVFEGVTDVEEVIRVTGIPL